MTSVILAIGLALVSLVLAGAAILIRRQRRELHQTAAALESQTSDNKQLAAKNKQLLRGQQDLKESEIFSRAVFEASQTGLLVVEPRTCQIMDANQAAGAVLGVSPDDLFGASATEFLPANHPNLLEVPESERTHFETTLRNKEGRDVPVIRSISYIAGDRNDMAVISFLDISSLKAAEEEIRESHRKLEATNEELKRHKDQIVQSEKLASIGQLAAGVAHEINNPIGFVTSNLGTIQEYLTSMTTILRMYEELEKLDPDQTEAVTAQQEAIAAAKDEEDLEFVFEDLENVVAESLEGVGRVAEIVQNLKSFAREDSQAVAAYDVNEGVEAMIKMSWNELKYKCEVEREFGEVPPLACHAGRVNQVIMNMLVNAAQAMPEDGGTITVRTGVEDDFAVITIADDGNGIPPEVLSRIFDPFFTTKEVGKGTGLGLSISHGIIEEHGGHIEVDSTVGEGTTFRIHLPLAKTPTAEMIG